MKKALLIWLLVVFSFVNTIAQDNLPVYEIKSDTALNDTLPGTYWQTLEDKDGKLIFEDVSKPPISNNFNYYSAKTKKLDFSSNTYWSRYVLKNAMEHEAKICFPTYGEQSDFYFIADGKISHQVNGFITPWSKLNGLKLYRYIPVVIKPKEELIVYNRASSKIFFGPPTTVSISATEKIIQENYIENEAHYFNGIHNSFIFGVLVFASLFIFFFFIMVRERLYLYFSLYLFFLGFGRFNIDLEFYHVFLREYPGIYFNLFNLVWVFPNFFLIYFIRYLLNTPCYLPQWDKFLFISNFVYAFIYLIWFALTFHPLNWIIFEHIPTDVMILTSMALVMCMPVTFLLILLRGVKLHRLLTTAVLPLLSLWCICSGVIGVAQVYDISGWTSMFSDFMVWLNRNWFLIETILLSLLTIFFSWILLHRFVELREKIVQKELEKEIERSQLIAEQKVELEKQVIERTDELNRSLNELKSTQSQLIQSEKMASLGELTAGIAHEIQNPLNFVNNFSEVNKELIEEIKSQKSKLKSEELDELLNDIADNEEKINHHGKRADAIVKSMMQHSRKSEGKKEPTDINALCDEYLRLAYHGLRAKDKNFSADFKTDFDDTIGNINIVPQDIGRVLLNLYNNAFYAVTEKSKQQSENYQPIVSVTTKKTNNKVEIRVADNGIGIPQKVSDKIFQPFFTTKPTGQGTGLGLSLSYDIIKAHRGEIKAESKEGERSEFIILLPDN